MLQSDRVYALQFRNGVKSGDVDPKQNFTDRRGYRFSRHPIVTEQNVVHLHKFTEIINMPKALTLMGYQLRPTVHEVPYMADSGRKFPCNIDNCKYKAATAYNLEKHVRNSHYNTQFPCTKCDYVARQSGNLQNHMRRKHPEIESPKKEKVKKTERVCRNKNCKKVFSSGDDRVNHEKRVHKMYRHQCPHCWKSFVRVLHLKQHVDRDHGKEYKSNQQE
jgi:activator of 2-hydroxyglutaryl-CoA dehydratase